MATQADGTVYINSSIDTDGFTAGGKEIEAAARRAAKTVKGIGDAARIALERQTAAFVKSNQLYAQQEQKVKDLQNKLEEMAGQTAETTAFKEIQKQIDTDTAKLNRLIQTQEEFLAAGGKEESSAYKRRQIQIEELKNSIEYAKAEQDELLASEKAYEAVDTSAIEQKLIDARERLMQMNDSLNVSYDALKSKVEQYGGTISEATKKENTLRKGFGSLADKVKKAAAAMLIFHKNTEKSNSSMGNGVRSILKYAIGITSLVAILKKVGSAIRNAVKEGFSNLYEENARFKSSVDNLKASLLTLKNALAAAFAPIVQTAIPYIQRFVQWITKAVNIVGQFIAALTGKKTYLKAVQQTASASSDVAKSTNDSAKASNKAAKATEKQADAMGEAKEAAQDYLSPLDEISRYEEDSADMSIDVPSDIDNTPIDDIADEIKDIGDSLGSMFEEIPIDSRILDFLEKLKNFLQPIIDYAKKLKDIFMQGFWDGLGDWQCRWESIKNSLESIKDSLIDIWTDPKVLAAADKWAQSVAYMLGSLVGSLASIGLTIATNIVGGIAKYLEQNKERIKQHLISMFDIWAEVNYLFADLFQSIAYVFEAFASEQGQQLTANIIGIFADAFMDILELASKLFRDIATIIIKPFVDNKEALRTALEGFLGVLAEVTGTIKQGIDDTFDKLNDVYDKHFKPFFDSVAQGLSDLVAKFLEFWNGNVQPILQQWSADFDELWKSHIQPLLNNAAEFLGKIVDLLKVLWENYLQPMIAWIIANVLPKVLPVIQAIWTTLKNLFGYIADMVSAVITILGGLIDFLTGVFSGDWEKAFQGLQDMVSGFIETIRITIEGGLQLISDLFGAFIEAWKAAIDLFVQAIEETIEICLNWIQENIIDKFEEIKKNFKDFIENVKEKWNSGWEALKEKVSSIAEGIKETIKSAFDWITEKIDSITDKLGGLGKTAGNIISGFGKSSSTRSYIMSDIQVPVMPIPEIANPQIPYLATGAVIPPNAPFLAVLGDQKRGTNVEAPISAIEDAVTNAMSKMGMGQGFNGTINLKVFLTGKQVYEEVISQGRIQQMMTGRNDFELA